MRVLPVAAFGETLAAIAVFVKFIGLQHRAHRTVDDEDALRQRVEQQLRALGMQPR